MICVCELHMDDSQMLQTVEVSVSRHVTETEDVPAGGARMVYVQRW